MGKQINFYMSEKVQASFIEHLEQNHFLFLDVNSQILKEPLSPNVFGLYLYKQNYGNVVMTRNLLRTFLTVWSFTAGVRQAVKW